MYQIVARAGYLSTGIRLRSRSERPAPAREKQKEKITGKRPPKGAVEQKLESANITKNEPVVSRNVFQWARPGRGAKLTPWLWAGGTKEVGTLKGTEGDPGRHGRCAAIEEWVYNGHADQNE